MRLYTMNRRICAWDELEGWRVHFRQLLHDQSPGRLPPFHLLSLPDMTAAEQRTCAELWMQPKHASNQAQRQQLDFQHARSPSPQRIRLGYLSNDFHEHATTRLLIEMFEAHDRQQFELFAYSYGADDGGPLRQRLHQAFDHFIDISALDQSGAAERIHQDHIDILVDLKGYTRGTRTNILGLRPAPVQVNYLGYPGTLGGDFCDYIITDPFITPPESGADYSEAFAYLPHSYQPRCRQTHLSSAPTRASVGLPETGFVFCSFNQTYKITPEIFDIWCQLLHSTPNSVLWLLQDAQANDSLRSQARQRGIPSERLIFAQEHPQQAHLERLQLADLMLDTLPYNAHTTASDALWAGVPVVTCSGQTFASRVAGSLLRAIHLSELVTHNLEDYFTLAHALANDPQHYQRIQQRLNQNRLTTPLFDIQGYTLHIEALYRQMWQRHQNGEAAGTLRVSH